MKVENITTLSDKTFVLEAIKLSKRVSKKIAKVTDSSKGMIGITNLLTTDPSVGIIGTISLPTIIPHARINQPAGKPCMPKADQVGLNRAAKLLRGLLPPIEQ